MTKRREPVLYRLALARRWNRTDANSVRYRLWRLASDRHPWWDWGHRVMTLVGQGNGGTFDSPEMRTVWKLRSVQCSTRSRTLRSGIGSLGVRCPRRRRGGGPRPR